MARRRLSAAHKAAISRSLRRKLGPTTGLDAYVPKPAKKKKAQSVSATPATPKVPEVAQTKETSKLHEADRQLNHLRAPKRDATPKKFTLDRPSDVYDEEMDERFQEAMDATGDWYGNTEVPFAEAAEGIAAFQALAKKRSSEGEAARKLLDDTRKHLAEVADNPQPRIEFPIAAVAGLLEKGRFVSASEHDPEERHKGNRDLFQSVLMGAPEPPVFGILRRGPMDDMHNPYGEFRAVLYPDKAQEATFTFGDSLLEQGVPQRVSEMKELSDAQLLSAAGVGSRAMDLASGLDGGGLEPESLVESAHYMEAQFHGGVSLTDIHHIEISEYEVDGSPEVTEAIRQLEAHGFEVRVNTESRHMDWVEENEMEGLRFG